MSVLLAYSGGANKLTVSPGSPPNTDPHTIAGWCYPTSATNFYEQVEINTSNNGISVLAGGASGTNICWRMSNSTFSAFTDITAVVSLSTWHHVAGTYDGTTMRLYVDGVAAGTATPGYGTRTGTWGVCAIGPTDGMVSDAVFYSAALSADDIAWLAGVRLPERRTNLEMHFPLWTGSAVRLVDYSGKGRNLALTGSASDGTLEPPRPWGTPQPYIIDSGVNNQATAAGNIVMTGSALAALGLAASASGQVRQQGLATPAFAADVGASGNIRQTGVANASFSGNFQASALGGIIQQAVANNTVSVSVTASGLIVVSSAAGATSSAQASGVPPGYGNGALRSRILHNLRRQLR